jgi:hypothetical protein
MRFCDLLLLGQG